MVKYNETYSTFTPCFRMHGTRHGRQPVHYGPMRLHHALLLAALLAPCANARDLSLFNLLRLDMPSADALPVPRDTWSFDAQLGYQNTWSMSPNVRDYFETRSARRRLDAADIADIRALPYEKFLVDMEVGVLDLAVHRRIDEHWSAYGIVGVVGYGGGFMDGPIERYHSALGFREDVRGAVPRNQATIIVDTGTTHYVRQDAPSSGVLDPTLGVRYRTGSFSIDAAVKLPLGGTRAFLSNGHADFGVQAAWQGAHGPHSGFVSLAGVSTSGGGVLETRGRAFVPTLAAGYEYAFGQGTSVLVNGNLSRYGLDSDDTGIGGLRQSKSQATFGLRHRSGRSTFTASLTEAFGAYNGMPDLAIHLGWTFD
jgi:hypothetical protein